MFMYSIKSSNGFSVPSWLTKSQTVLFKRIVRQSKREPLVDEVKLIDVNPCYARVEFPNGRVDTLSLENKTLLPFRWFLTQLSFLFSLFLLINSHFLLSMLQWRNVACWRPSAPTAPPFLAPLLHLKSKAKLNKLSYFRKYATKIYKSVCF